MEQKLNESEYQKHPAVFWFVGFIILYIFYQVITIIRKGKIRNVGRRGKYSYYSDEESSYQVGFKRYGPNDKASQLSDPFLDSHYHQRE